MSNENLINLQKSKITNLFIRYKNLHFENSTLRINFTNRLMNIFRDEVSAHSDQEIIKYNVLPEHSFKFKEILKDFSETLIKEHLKNII